MHQWKVPLKYRAMLLFPSGPLGLGGAADTMVWGGVPTKWREQKSTSTYILKLCRNSKGVHYFVTKASSRCHCHCRCHSPSPQPRLLLGFIVVVVVILIVTSVTTIFPPSSVIYLIVEFVLSSCPLPFLIRWWPSHPPHPPSWSLSLLCRCRRPLLPPPPPRDLFDCCLHVVVPRPSTLPND